MEWQTIETAPKDKRILLARIAEYGLCGVADGYFIEPNIWAWPYIKQNPTHWMPLPEAPSDVKYGCHCDLEENMKPDSCVLDKNKPDDCIFAKGLISRGLGKESCDEWRPIIVNGK